MGFFVKLAFSKYNFWVCVFMKKLFLIIFILFVCVNLQGMKNNPGVQGKGGDCSHEYILLRKGVKVEKSVFLEITDEFTTLLEKDPKVFMELTHIYCESDYKPKIDLQNYLLEYKSIFPVNQTVKNIFQSRSILMVNGILVFFIKDE